MCGRPTRSRCCGSPRNRNRILRPRNSSGWCSRSWKPEHGPGDTRRESRPEAAANAAGPGRTCDGWLLLRVENYEETGRTRDVSRLQKPRLTPQVPGNRLLFRFREDELRLTRTEQFQLFANLQVL